VKLEEDTMGIVTIRRPSGRSLRLSVSMGRSHKASELNDFERELKRLTKKYDLRARKRRPKK
jgi:hypothetical protein